MAGGPFDGALGRLGLLGTDALPTPRTATLLAGLAWLLPALLATAQAVADERTASWAYFSDFTVYARFLVGTWAMLATESYADGRFTLLTRAFLEAKIVAEDEQPAFHDALRSADDRTSSWLAELAILAVAVSLAGLTTSYAVSLAGSSWEGTATAGMVDLSWAGNASRFVSTPLFLFLGFRWLWRFGVWAALLHRISRLPLQLTPLHPDRAAGLGFLAIYPGIFSGFVIALSCTISSSFLKDLALEQHSPQAVWLAMATWLGLCLAFFLGPLLVFIRPLYLARERALLEYGRLASQHHLAFHRKWSARGGEELMGSPDPSSASDLNASVEAVLGMRVIPVDRVAVIQLVVSAGIPLVAVVARLIPLPELLKWIAGGLL